MAALLAQAFIEELAKTLDTQSSCTASHSFRQSSSQRSFVARPSQITTYHHIQILFFKTFRQYGAGELTPPGPQRDNKSNNCIGAILVYNFKALII
jgi:hypothetical protein